MIFVTVGSHYNGFERLITKMDEIAGKIDERVVMQIGFTKYTPKNADYFRFLESDAEMKDYFENARIIVSHAGAGTVLTALLLNKPLILVPRSKALHEHNDEQQFELARKMQEEKKALVVFNIDLLEESLSTLPISPAPFKINATFIVYLRKCIRNFYGIL